MSRACRNCQAPIGPGKQLCEVCRATLTKMRSLEYQDEHSLRMAGTCPRCHEPWRIDRSRSLKICQACVDRGEINKSQNRKLRLAQVKEEARILNEEYEKRTRNTLDK